MKKILLTTVVLLGLGYLSQAHAIDYIGAGFGQSTFEEGLLNDSSSVRNATGFSVAEEDGDTAIKIFTGIELNENAQIQFGYQGLGERYTAMKSHLLGFLSLTHTA